MSNWSDFEKEALLVALQKYGSENLKAISSHLPTKSLCEIEMLITKYAKRARAESREVFLAIPTTITDVNPIFLKRRRIPNLDYLAPLDKWIEFIDKFNDCSFAVSRLAIAKTFKLIAESEEGNNPFIKEAYHYLSQIFDGHIPKIISDDAMQLVHYCLYELSEIIVTNRQKNINVFLKNKFTAGFNIPKKTYGRKNNVKNEGFTQDNAINPLKMPESLLQHSIIESAFTVSKKT